MTITTVFFFFFAVVGDNRSTGKNFAVLNANEFMLSLYDYILSRLHHRDCLLILSYFRILKVFVCRGGANLTQRKVCVYFSQ